MLSNPKCYNNRKAITIGMSLWVGVLNMIKGLFLQCKNVAFTLAEVLIVLGIIGIIADMTIPTLKRDIDKIVYVTQLKKAYSTLHQGVQMTMVNDGVFSITDSSVYCQESDCMKAGGNWAKKTFNVVSDFGRNPTSSCFATSYKTLNKGAAETPDGYVVGLADGSCIGVWQSDGTNFATEIAIDTNGAKKPNIAGRDLFWLYIYKDGFIGERFGGLDIEDNKESICNNNDANSYGWGCFTKIMHDGWKMDY